MEKQQCSPGAPADSADCGQHCSSEGHWPHAAFPAPGKMQLPQPALQSLSIRRHHSRVTDVCSEVDQSLVCVCVVSYELI